MRENIGEGMRGERLSVREEGRGGGSEQRSGLDPDPRKILRIRPNDTDPLYLDPQHCPEGTCSAWSKNQKICEKKRQTSPV